MASPSQCQWSMMKATDSSTVELSTFPCRSSIFLSCQVRRRRFFNFAADKSSSSSSPSSFSSSSSISTSSTSNSGSRSKRLRGSDDYGKKLTEDADCEKDDVALVALNGIRAQRRRKLNFKSLFERRSLWRRILFASKKVRSIILLNVITVIYASNIPIVKEVEAVMDPAAFTVVRFVVSAIPFVPFIFRARDDLHTRNAGVELGIWVSLGYLMQSLGLLTSDAGRASFISMFTVIVVPLLDGMLGGVIPARTWFGALMSILGVAMLETSGSPPCVGDLLNFLSAVFFGVHMLRTEHISRSTNRKNFLPLLGYEVCVIALFSSLWYLAGGLHHEQSSWTWTMCWDWMVTFPWIPALYTGVVSTGLCLWIEMAAMRDVSATETAIIYGLEPVWGAGFAWFLLGERWGPLGWLGAALVLGGSLTVQIIGSSNPTEEDKRSSKGDRSLSSEKQNGLSTSPVVNSRSDSPDILKK